MNLLITGGAGFIGSNLIYYIVEKYPDYKIINLDNLTYAGNLKNLKNLENNSNYKFIKGDINDYDLVDKIIKENNIDTIIHLAAESHVDKSITGPDQFITTNIVGTHNLLKLALANNKIRFHHVSTDEVFGSLGEGDPKFTEESAYDPRSPYSASKASSDHLVRSYYHTFDLPITISNCSNNYGPYQHKEKMMPLFIDKLLKSEQVPIYGDGRNIRDWLYVTDHCRAIDLIVHQGKIGETYLVGGDSEMRNINIAKLLADKLGHSANMIKLVKDRPGHDWRYAIDASKIKKELGWEPQINFEQGITKTIKWYKSNL
jgi:dTDP-glucose 4,6-dehydratase